MPFQLKKPNAAKWDLKSDKLECFHKALDIVRGYGKAQIVREAVLVQIIQEFGEERVLLCLERWCARAMTSLDRLQSLLEGAEPLTFEKQHMNEMPGRERQRQENQTKTVGAFLDEIKKNPGAAEPIQRATSVKKLPEGWMNRDMMLAWMRDNHPDDLDLVEDYFNYLGVDPKHGPLYKLIVRVSQ